MKPHPAIVCIVIETTMVFAGSGKVMTCQVSTDTTVNKKVYSQLMDS